MYFYGVPGAYLPFLKKIVFLPAPRLVPDWPPISQPFAPGWPTIGLRLEPEWAPKGRVATQNNNLNVFYLKSKGPCLHPTPPKEAVGKGIPSSSSASPIQGKDLTICPANTKEITLSYHLLPKDRKEDEVTKFLKDKNLKPVFVYDNLSNSSVKTRVLNETPGLSGIYLILNKVTLDYYIGSASTGKFYARFTNHLFNLNGSKVVKNAVKKYEISSFAFIVLELFPEIVNKENNKKLLDLEDFYLKSLLPNYNILTEAGSSFGYKHTEITRINMKANYSEERRRAIGNLNKGKILSPWTIDIIRQAALNRTKPIYSPEAIKNMQKRSKAILVYNLDYTVYAEFSSIVDAAKSLGCDQKTIRRALKSPKGILRRRWIVKFV
uniref:GIY-YIG homing endonuclease n=1 Tax=Tephrocybe rancida TaxID=117070 RepID=A0A386TYF3_9AGAR|nr:GIY-YIG homing endonuclease [Tephrocybe rancida]AYE93171.1 GIY-YIG homing endonuclease [Tephrocybe rancida]